MLQIYNTFTKKKEIFYPLQEKRIFFYVCGVTVYDYCHIGHARTYLIFDMIIRFLKWRGYKIYYIRNITDIDDKIIYHAKKNKENIFNLTSRFIKIMNKEFLDLGMLKPNQEPRVTENIDHIINMINILLKNRNAYISKNNNIYFRVSSFPGYGKLSGQNINELKIDNEINQDQEKENPLDFAVWKSVSEDQCIGWMSPWGYGRPGWHIECSVMVNRYLEKKCDIHGGGKDLCFPHHENEIAQFESVYTSKIANYWMHTGMVRYKNQKMSKSLGNICTIHNIRSKYPSEVIRYFFFLSHYRKNISYDEKKLLSAKFSLIKLYSALQNMYFPKKIHFQSSYTKQFIDSMNDDFNTPKAIFILFKCAKKIKSLKKTNFSLASKYAYELKYLGSILGILQENPKKYLKSTKNILDENIQSLIKKREIARKNKDWKNADKIRNILSDYGIHIKDKSILE